jgi:hypothetical protein
VWFSREVVMMTRMSIYEFGKAWAWSTGAEAWVKP